MLLLYMHPTSEQVYSINSWVELFSLLGIELNKSKQCQEIKRYVRETYPDANVCVIGRNYKVSDADFLLAIETSISIKEALKKCGLSTLGSAYIAFKDRVAQLNADISHFTGQPRHRNKCSRKKEIDYYLVNNGPNINSHKLKLKLIETGLKLHQCEMCKRTEWNGKIIPIALDHINGDHKDNRIENLRIICPNCHAQTDTFCGKNIKSKPKKEKIKNNRCPVCFCACSRKYCSTICSSISQSKIDWGSVNILEEIKSKSIRQLSRELGLTHAALQKRIKRIKIK